MMQVSLLTRMIMLSALFPLLMLPRGASGSGVNYYVAANGSDGNRGTLSAPWQSIQFALTAAGAGDTIFVRAGVYHEDEVWIRGGRGMGGANGQYLTIKNYPGETPFLSGGRGIIVDDAPYVRIEGLYFQLPYCISGGGQGFQVIHNIFVGPQPRYGAIQFFSDNGLIEGNKIDIRGGGDRKDHGIYLHAGYNNVIRNNLISGCSGYAIHVYDAMASAGPRAAQGYGNILIEGNVISGSQRRDGIIISPGAGVAARGIRIQGNIFVNNVINGIRLRANTRGIKIYNNTFYGNGWGADNEDDQSAISIRDSSVQNVEIKNNIIEVTHPGAFHIQNRERSIGVVAERNLYWGSDGPRLKHVVDSKPLYGNPLFVNPKENDFDLVESSPAVDAGINLGLPFLGFGPDVGASEFIQK